MDIRRKKMGNMWLTGDIYKKGLIPEGIICLDTASGIHDLTTCMPSPVMLYSPYETELCGSYICMIPHEIDYADTELITGKLYVTNKERTICELIAERHSDSLIYEALENYLAVHPVEGLYKVSDKYVERDQLDYYINTLQDYRNEDW